MAFMRGVAKHLFEKVETDPKAIDKVFIKYRTAGFEAYKAVVDGTSWSEIEHQSGLTNNQIRAAAEIYREAHAAIISGALALANRSTPSIQSESSSTCSC